MNEEETRAQRLWKVAKGLWAWAVWTVSLTFNVGMILVIRRLNADYRELEDNFVDLGTRYSAMQDKFIADLKQSKGTLQESISAVQQTQDNLKLCLDLMDVQSGNLELKSTTIELLFKENALLEHRLDQIEEIVSLKDQQIQLITERLATYEAAPPGEIKPDP